MAGTTDLLVLVAIGAAALMFGPQIMAQIENMAKQGGEGGGAGTEQQQQAAQQQPEATSTSSTTVIAPTPLTVGYPYIQPYPIGFLPYGGYPWRWPPVLGHFSEPRRFNWAPWGPWRRPGPWPHPWPHRGPRFLGPPVPAPGPH